MITAGQWRAAVAPLLPEKADWAFKAKLTYRRPVGWTLRGVKGEGSGWSRDHVYVWVLQTPLFVPQDVLVLDHGHRVQSGPVAAEALPAVLRGAVQMVKSETDALRSIAATDTEESRYAWLLLGEYPTAERLLGQPFCVGDDRPFAQDARNRLSTVAELLRNGGPDAALTQLRTWRDGTCSALGSG